MDTRHCRGQCVVELSLIVLLLFYVFTVLSDLAPAVQHTLKGVQLSGRKHETKLARIPTPGL